MEAIIAILNKWIASPLMTRASNNKTYNLAAYMEDHARYLEARQKDVTDTGKEIHSYLKASNEVLKVSKGAPAWRAYVEYINGILVSGIADTVVASLGHLLSQIDPKQIEAGGQVASFFDVKLDLNRHGKGDDASSSRRRSTGRRPRRLGDGLRAVAHLRLLQRRQVHQARLDRAEGDFLKEMEENEEVRFHVHRIIDECEPTRGVQGVSQAALPQAQAPVGEGHPGTSLEFFLEEEGTETEPMDGARSRRRDRTPAASAQGLPGADHRAARRARDQGDRCQHDMTEGWLKIDAKPIKTALGDRRQVVVDAHTPTSRDFVDNELADLQEFIARVNEGLQRSRWRRTTRRAHRGDDHVRDVRLSRPSPHRQHLQPLRKTITLLKKFGIIMPEEIIECLEMIPFKWEDTKKVTLNARELLGPLQSLQQEKVREYTDEFRRACRLCKRLPRGRAVRVRGRRRRGVQARS